MIALGVKGIIISVLLSYQVSKRIPAVRRAKAAPHKQFGESWLVNGSKTPCGVAFIYETLIVYIRILKMVNLFEYSEFLGGIAILLVMVVIFGIWNLIENRKRTVVKLKDIFVKCVFFFLFLGGTLVGLRILLGVIKFAIDPSPPNNEGINYLLLITFGFGVGGYVSIQCIRMLNEFLKKDGAFKNIIPTEKDTYKSNDALVAAITILFLFILGWWYMFAN